MFSLTYLLKHYMVKAGYSEDIVACYGLQISASINHIMTNLSHQAKNSANYETSCQS